MRTRAWVVAVVAVALGCGDDGGATADGGVTFDAAPAIDAVDCGGDPDGDGVPNCMDDDDDGDNLSDDDEAALGTDPGMPTLLVEIDYMADGAGGDFGPSQTALDLTTDSFAAVGIEVVLDVDAGGALTRLSPLTASADMESVASGSKGEGASHVHVVMADRGSGTGHGTSHYASPNDGTFGDRPGAEYSAAFVFAGQIEADHQQYATSFFTPWGISVDHLIARTLIHEIGHLIGCTHESSDPGNVMAQNSLVGAVNNGTMSRWQDAALGKGHVGYPTFLEGSIDQIDLTLKAAADMGTSPSQRAFDMGPSASATGAGTFAVAETTAFDVERGFGWVDALPTEASTTGSNTNDDRFADYVAGDPTVEADTVFRIEGLGSHRVRVNVRVGKTGGADRAVRCEIRHPTQGTGWFSTTLTSSNTFRQYWYNPVFPVSPEVTGAFGRSYLEVRCLDDATRDDAPIEYLRIEKLNP